MWGHAASCGCPICLSLPRIFTVIREGSELPTFVGCAGVRLRITEGELRDEVARGRAALGPGPPPPGPAPPRETEVSQPAAAAPPPASAPPAEEVKQELQGLTAKASPHPPPGVSSGSLEEAAPAAPKEEVDKTEEPRRTAEEEETLEKPKVKPKKKKSRSRSRGRRRREEREEERPARSHRSRDRQGEEPKGPKIKGEQISQER